MGVRDLCMVRRAGVAVSVANVVFLWGLLACRTALFALAVSLCRLGTLWLRRDFLPHRGLLAVRGWQGGACAVTYLGTCNIRRCCGSHEGGSSAGGRGMRARRSGTTTTRPSYTEPSDSSPSGAPALELLIQEVRSLPSPAIVPPANASLPTAQPCCPIVLDLRRERGLRIDGTMRE